MKKETKANLEAPNHVNYYAKVRGHVNKCLIFYPQGVEEWVKK